MKQVIFLWIMMTTAQWVGHAQSVGIGTATPNATAQLDISSNSKGVLIPRLTQAQRIAISSPATGLLVYQSDADSSFFWYNGSAWVKLLSSNSGWTLTGNAGTGNSNFIGTTDDRNLVFRRNNIRAGLIDTANTSFGLSALASGTASLYNTAVGRNSLFSNTTGNSNTATGNAALYSNTAGIYNTATGDSALFANSTGAGNTALGIWSLRNNLVGNTNVAVGAANLYSNIDGQANVGVGWEALFANVSGSNNVAIGAQTLKANTVGTDNIGVGHFALYRNTTGNRNISLGSNSLYENTSGNGNIAIGSMTLVNNLSRSNLIAIGDSALYNNGIGAVSGTQAVTNIAIGERALKNNSLGSQNTALGSLALLNNTIGTGLTAIGANAGLNTTTGNYNTAIGSSATFGAGNLTNATAIGAFATVNTSNSMVLGNNVNVGIGISSPLERLHVAGTTRTDGFIMTTGAGSGKILVSNAVGAASWENVVRLQRASIPAASFRPMSLSHESQIFPEGEIVGSNTSILTAPVNLPDGAVITNVFFYVFDGSDIRQVVGKLYAYQNGNNNIVELTSGSTGMAFTAGYTSFNTSISHTVNNGLYSYSIQAYSFDGAFVTFWSDLRLESVVITYTYNVN